MMNDNDEKCFLSTSILDGMFDIFLKDDVKLMTVQLTIQMTVQMTIAQVLPSQEKYILIYITFSLQMPFLHSSCVILYTTAMRS